MSQASKESACIDTIFVAALEIASPEARAAYLDHACGADTELRRRANQLLDAHFRAGSFLDLPASESLTAMSESIPEGPGTVLGPYQLLEQIGEGGFGLVYMARQQHPIRRLVAVKILKPGMDSRQVIARFEAERQALALMDHPNIARVLDAGETPAGRPHFVMELVRGVPITEYCDRHGLPTPARLDLFVSVCAAVQHAHQKGIIHRDIKPSNVLVTMHDDKPVVKVIDFGIAKAIGQPLTDKTLCTGFAQMVGTPLYMSPEQAQMNGLDVDTRTDVYSLGVLLYELLTGTTPFDKDRLRSVDYDEMRRIIREEEPPRPSIRLTTLGDAVSTISARRQTDPRQLGRLFCGELDWIVMRALEKDRTRRYDTASAFAEDVRRYLNDEPVVACPPTAWYRFGKFARRNKGTLVTALAVSVALVVGTAVSAWQAIQATNAQESERQALIALDGELKRTEQAEEKAKRDLFDSWVAQARANRLSRRIGQRFQTLEILHKANGLARQLKLPPERFREMRNEVIAALALPDLRVAKEWPDDTGHSWHFDAALQRYAYVDRQGTVQVRRAGDGMEIYRLAELGPRQHSTHLSPDGGYLAVYDERGWVQVWSLTGAEPARILNERGIGAFRFGPDSRQFALQQPGGSIGIFDLKLKTKVRNLPSCPRASCLAFHPDGDRLALAYKGCAQVSDVQTGKVLWQKNHSPVANTEYAPWVDWHPGGKILALGDSDAISLWDVAKDQQISKLDGIPGGGVYFTFNPAGTMLASCGWSGILRLWDPLTGRQLLSSQLRPESLQFSADGRFVAATHPLVDKNLRIWEIAAGHEYRTLVASPLKGKRKYGSPAISPGGHFLAVGADGGVALWDLPAGKELAFLDGPSLNFVAWEPHPAIAAPGEQDEALLSLGESGLIRRTIRAEPLGGAVHIGPAQRLPVSTKNCMFAQSRSGRVLATAQRQGVVVLDRVEPNPVFKLQPHADVRHVAVSPDGKWIVTGRFSYPPGGAKVWQLERLGQGLAYKFVKDLPAEFGCRVAFSPDGKHLLTSSVLVSTNHPVRRWEVGTWVPIPFAEPVQGAMLAFSPDGKLLAVETGSGVARLVDPETGREYAQLEDPNQDRATDYTFSPDGTKLVCANGDGYCVHVWDLQAIRQQLVEMKLDWRE